MQSELLPRRSCSFFQMSSKMFLWFRELSPVLLFFLIISPVIASSSVFDDCVPQRCGNHSIQFPFWLQGQQPSFCGLPQFSLNCTDQTGSLDLSVSNFTSYLINISYDSAQFTLADDNPCVALFSNSSLDLYPFRYSSSNKRIFFLFDCAGSDGFLSYQNFTCPGYNSRVFFGGEYDPSRVNFPGGNCSLGVVPVMSYYSNISTSSDYRALVRAGRLVNWTAPDCSECSGSGGRCGYNATGENTICICHNGIFPARCGRVQRRNFKRAKLILAAAGLLGFLICLIALVQVYRKKKHHAKNIKSVETILNDRVASLPKRYKYSEVKEMTKSFSCKLGQGGYGIVYKGTLRNGHRVAVKILNESTGNVEEFLNEVASISVTSHVNVVGLVGFCLQGSKRALVYDFMSNGSLDRFIYATTLFDCEKLYDIAMGIARGLEYLHLGCKNRIVHFDIKPHNILLDEDFSPKISDFGLAKLCHTKESIVSMTYPRGTPGYIAPEVFSKNFGRVTSKADVYSYGMMVLEMVGLRKDFDVAAETASELYFYDWVFDCIDTNNEIGISCLNGKNKEIATRLIIVSLWCIQMTPSNRPSMSVVVDMLQESIEDLPMPPKP